MQRKISQSAEFETGKQEKRSMMGAIRELKPGETLVYPLTKMFSIKSMVSAINTIRGHKTLSTSVDKGGNTIRVICADGDIGNEPD